MIYYRESDSIIKDKVKVVLDLSNYATKKQSEYATDINTSDLSAKKDFIALKAEVDKLDINKLTNVPTILNNTLILNKFHHIVWRASWNLNSARKRCFFLGLQENFLLLLPLVLFLTYFVHSCLGKAKRKTQNSKFKEKHSERNSLIKSFQAIQTKCLCCAND